MKNLKEFFATLIPQRVARERTAKKVPNRSPIDTSPNPIFYRRSFVGPKGGMIREAMSGKS